MNNKGPVLRTLDAHITTIADNGMSGLTAYCSCGWRSLGAFSLRDAAERSAHWHFCTQLFQALTAPNSEGGR